MSEKTPNQKRRKCVDFKGCWYFGGTFEKQQKRGRDFSQPLDFVRKNRLFDLTLRELEALTRLGLAVFLTLNNAAIAGQEAFRLHSAAQQWLILRQCLSDAMLDRASLTRKATA